MLCADVVPSSQQAHKLTFQPLGIDLYGMNTPLKVLKKVRKVTTAKAIHIPHLLDMTRSNQQGAFEKA